MLVEPVPDAKHDALLALTREVRTLFQALRQCSDDMLADLGVTAAQRAVMEALVDGPATAPDIARARRVTRQHIQTGVDALRRKRLVERHANPASRRSPLIALTSEGRSLFEAIREREAAVISELAADLDDRRVAEATELLRALTVRL